MRRQQPLRDRPSREQIYKPVATSAVGSPMREQQVLTRAQILTTQQRAQRFIPPIPWPIAARVCASVSSARTAGLYFAVYLEMRRLKAEAVRVPNFMLADLGLGAPSSRSRAVKELEKLGLIRVKRRPGFAPLITATQGGDSFLQCDLEIQGHRTA